VSSLLIEDLSVLDESERVPGVVKIIAYGGDDAEIQRVITDTRAAGIRVEFSRPTIVHIDLAVVLHLSRGVDPARAEREVEVKVRDYLAALNIGDDVVFHRIVRAILDADGVYDIDALTIKAYRPEAEEATTSTGENLHISAEEMAVARVTQVSVRTAPERRE
jgi:uncharacterized phage protein gp47/JayE